MSIHNIINCEIGGNGVWRGITGEICHAVVPRKNNNAGSRARPVSAKIANVAMAFDRVDLPIDRINMAPLAFHKYFNVEERRKCTNGFASPVTLFFGFFSPPNFIPFDIDIFPVFSPCLATLTSPPFSGSILPQGFQPMAYDPNGTDFQQC